MYERILVPIDGSATADKGLEQAIAVARLSGGRIRLIHIVDDLAFPLGFETGATYIKTVLPALRRESERILAAGRQRVAEAGVPVDVAAVECFAKRTSDVVIEQAQTWPADLIVIGTHGRRGVSRLMLGSDAEEVVRMAPVPVLLVRSDDRPAGASARALSAAVSSAQTAATV